MAQSPQQMGSAGSVMRVEERLEEENRRLRRSVEELSILAEIAAATSREESLHALIEIIVKLAVGAFDVEQGVVYLLSEDSSQPAFETMWRTGRSSREHLPVRVNDQLLGWMLKHQRVLMVNDPAEAPVAGLSENDPPVRSLLSAPLRFKGQLMGLLILFNKKRAEGFSTDDRRLLGIIAGQAAPVLHTAKLIGELRQDRERLADENSKLWREINSQFASAGVIGSSSPVQEALGMIERIRDADVDVLITGESGTGKELYAKTIHYMSKRARRPFIALNCAALPENLVEAELFGIEKGVATGVEKRIGQFEAADKGTLFLDEIGDLNLTAQAKILRVLQERVVQRLGGRQTIAVDVRVIAATNKDLEKEVQDGTFREDLFYRLNVIRIRTPPLREIRDDIEPLASFFLAQSCKQVGRDILELSPAAMACLESYPWPGNVRQLQNEIKRAAIVAPGPVIEREDLSPEIQAALDRLPRAEAGASQSRPLHEAVAEYERQLLQKALQAHHNNQARTADALGVSRQGLIKKMKRLGL